MSLPSLKILMDHGSIMSNHVHNWEGVLLGIFKLKGWYNAMTQGLLKFDP
jgi:hypothetical protein